MILRVAHFRSTPDAAAAMTAKAQALLGRIRRADGLAWSAVGRQPDGDGALIIAVSQMKDLFGLSSVKGSANLIEVIPALWAAKGAINPIALIVGVASIGGIALLRRMAPWFPGSRSRVGAG